MAEKSAPTSMRAPNTIVFCQRPWKAHAIALWASILFTFVWGFYLLDDLVEETELEDLSVSHLLFQDAALPGAQRVYDYVPAAVVGVGDARANATPIAAGSIVGASGYVLTTAHALAGLTEVAVYVTTPTGARRYEAQAVKTMPGHDLVLLKMLTQERFLYLTLANTQALSVGEPVFAFGADPQGHTIVKAGSLLANNAALTVDTGQVTHLLRTNAVYTWAQSGGPLVNGAGELVGVNLPVETTAGSVEGYAVPSHVILAHFQDVVQFRQHKAQQQPSPSTGPTARAPMDAPRLDAPVTAPPSAPRSVAWWANARSQVASPDVVGPLGSNAAWGGGPPPQATTSGAAGGGQVGGVADQEHTTGLRIGRFLLQDILGLFLLAVVVGLTGGMMTMGGGVLQVAGMMVFFGYGMYLIRPVAYLTNVFVYGASALRNDRAGLVMWDHVKALVPWAVVGVIAGYFVGNVIGDRVVYYLLGIFALLMAAKGLHEIFADDAEHVLAREGRNPSASPQPRDRYDELLDAEPQGSAARTSEGLGRSAMLGTPMGLVSGVLGISGGVLEVPLQRYLGGINLRNAIANSSVLVFWASLTGAILAFAHGISSGQFDYEAPIALALVMVPGAFLGGMVGARLMRVLPTIALKTIYTLIMLAIAGRILLGG